MEHLIKLGPLAAAANFALALSILALTISSLRSDRRPSHARSWLFFGLASATLLVHAALDLAGAQLLVPSELSEVATTGLLGIGFVFLYGSDRDAMRRIQQQADTDPLTGLYNLRAFTSLGLPRLQKTNDHGGRCAVAVLDVDGFKQINDSLGHLAGDRLLQIVATAMRANLRAHDLAARYGGDEFVLFLDRCDRVEAAGIVKRMLRTVLALSTGVDARVSLSAGIAVSPDSGTDLSELIRRADEMLLDAKRGGKNEVVVAAPNAPAAGSRGEPTARVAVGHPAPIQSYRRPPDDRLVAMARSLRLLDEGAGMPRGADASPGGESRDQR